MPQLSLQIYIILFLILSVSWLTELGANWSYTAVHDLPSPSNEMVGKTERERERAKNSEDEGTACNHKMPTCRLVSASQSGSSHSEDPGSPPEDLAYGCCRKKIIER